MKITIEIPDVVYQSMSNQLGSPSSEYSQKDPEAWLSMFVADLVYRTFGAVATPEAQALEIEIAQKRAQLEALARPAVTITRERV